MQFKIYLDKKDLNDATTYYIDIIKDSILRCQQNVDIVYSVDDIMESDIVIVVKVTSFFRVKLHNSKQTIITWLQGIQPEEMLISNTPLLKKCYLYIALRLLEKYCFAKGDGFIYVSQEMKKHYYKRFHRTSDFEFIMPCFNLDLDEESFSVKGKYQSPTFVYAGSLDNWQAFPLIVKTFCHIKKELPNAKLTVLTREIDKANSIVTKEGLEDVTVKYVRKDDVQEELKKYKYGLILRKDCLVNRVATPTKINSYLASGVIPIVSDCLVDFASHMKGNKTILNVPASDDPSVIAKVVIAYENETISIENIKHDIEYIFKRYYNREYYIQELSKLIRKICE